MRSERLEWRYWERERVREREVIEIGRERKRCNRERGRERQTNREGKGKEAG